MQAKAQELQKNTDNEKSHAEAAIKAPIARLRDDYQRRYNTPDSGAL